jgi:hypothetical protein
MPSRPFLIATTFPRSFEEGSMLSFNAFTAIPDCDSPPSSATPTPRKPRKGFNAFTAIPDCDKNVNGVDTDAFVACFNAFTAIPDCDSTPCRPLIPKDLQRRFRG